ncbi:DNA recombination protein RmuC, partial [Acidithiobacillus caldus]|nr:DNA recombination protein RmuC [Acidithiobacillus caldus]
MVPMTSWWWLPPILALTLALLYLVWRWRRDLRERDTLRVERDGLRTELERFRAQDVRQQDRIAQLERELRAEALAGAELRAENRQIAELRR